MTDAIQCGAMEMVSATMNVMITMAPSMIPLMIGVDCLFYCSL